MLLFLPSMKSRTFPYQSVALQNSKPLLQFVAVAVVAVVAVVVVAVVVAVAFAATCWNRIVAGGVRVVVGVAVVAVVSDGVLFCCWWVWCCCFWWCWCWCCDFATALPVLQ